MEAGMAVLGGRPRWAHGTYGRHHIYLVERSTPPCWWGWRARTMGPLGKRRPGGVAWQRIRASFLTFAMFWFELVMIIGEVGFLGLLQSGGVQVGPLLRHSTNGQPPIKSWLVALHGHAWTQTHFIHGQCMQHWKIARGKGRVPRGPIVSGRSIRQRSIMVSFIWQMN